MHFQWTFDADDIQRVRDAVEQQKSSELVKDRYKCNLASKKSPPSRDDFWYASINAMLTSNQPSGPTSKVSQFLRIDPFPLSLTACENCNDLATMVRDELKVRGVRFWKTRLPGFIAANIDKMQGKAWDEIA